MAWKLDAIEQMQLPRQRRVDGVGRPKFDFHTGDGDGDASGSARLADYADVEAGGDVRRRMGGARFHGGQGGGGGRRRAHVLGGTQSYEYDP